MIKEYKAEVTIKIDYDKCKGHAECVEACPASVYELVENRATAPNVQDCIECCACVAVCPEDAIEHSSC